MSARRERFAHDQQGRPACRHSESKFRGGDDEVRRVFLDYGRRGLTRIQLDDAKTGSSQNQPHNDPRGGIPLDQQNQFH